jgi:hypothetical protein
VVVDPVLARKHAVVQLDLSRLKREYAHVIK